MIFGNPLRTKVGLESAARFVIAASVRSTPNGQGNKGKEKAMQADTNTMRFQRAVLDAKGAALDALETAAQNPPDATAPNFHPAPHVAGAVVGAVLGKLVHGGLGTVAGELVKSLVEQWLALQTAKLPAPPTGGNN